MYEQYIAHMQVLFSFVAYDGGMAAKSRLRELRQAAGLSGRELARQIGESSTNVSYWERSGQIPRSDVLAPMAKALGVTVGELLGEPKPRRNAAPGGRLGQVFEAVSKLPRRQQQKVIEMAEGFIALHNNASDQSKAA
jgi:transcriptional regulator with XRE-family HTH domain